MTMVVGEGGPFEEVDAVRIGIAGAPHLFGGEHQHRGGVADEGVEQRVENGATGGALGGLGAGRGVDVAVEPVLADVEIEGREVFVAERSEEHTSELQSLMRISYAVFCL